ncbi:MAG TPA: Sec-independent protein translocase protein TatB [Stellaceae bacterium]|nr:Sec-independent protein translocase protein TatB [Stellaceae bacterium]
MFDFSWSEIVVIGVVALVAIGPKDLPKALRTAGIMVRRARSLAREFHNSIDEMIREAELDEMRKRIDETVRLQPAEPTPVAPPENTTEPKIAPPDPPVPIQPEPAESAPPEPAPTAASEHKVAEAPPPEPHVAPPEP